MDFFGPPPPPPDDDWATYIPPPWFQPPDDVLAALVPDRRVLARRGPVVLMLSHIDAYPTGCRFYVRAVAHRDDGMAEDDWWDLHDLILEGSRRRGRRSRQQLPDMLLRFGVQYTDGTKATTTESSPTLGCPAPSPISAGGTTGR